MASLSASHYAEAEAPVICPEALRGQAPRPCNNALLPLPLLPPRAPSRPQSPSMSSLGGPTLPGHQKDQSTKHVGHQGQVLPHSSPTTRLPEPQTTVSGRKGSAGTAGMRRITNGNREKVTAGNTDRARPILDTAGSHRALTTLRASCFITPIAQRGN